MKKQLIRVMTETGSIYMLDLAAGVMTRAQGALSDPLRMDGEHIRLLKFQQLAVGEPMIALIQLEGRTDPTVRTTSTVTSIQRIDVEDPADQFSPSHEAE